MTEFWPQGLQGCHDDAADYLLLLENLGFSLFELKGRIFSPVVHERLISQVTGRKYANIIGFKTESKFR